MNLLNSEGVPALLHFTDQVSDVSVAHLRASISREVDEVGRPSPYDATDLKNGRLIVAIGEVRTSLAVANMQAPRLLEHLVPIEVTAIRLSGADAARQVRRDIAEVQKLFVDIPGLKARDLVEAGLSAIDGLELLKGGLGVTITATFLATVLTFEGEPTVIIHGSR